MRNLLFIFLALCLSCKSASSLTNTLNSTEENINEAYDSSSRGTINFEGNIINVYSEPLTLCGTPQNNMVSLQLSEIIESSTSLINKPQKEKTVFFKFLGDVANLKSGNNIRAYAKEYLCKNGVETYFVVTEFKKY